MRIWISPKRGFTFYRGVGLSYAYKGGGPILRDEKRKWRFINGFWIGARHRSIWFLFRRDDLL